jgi:hypothetical protein
VVRHIPYLLFGLIVISAYTASARMGFLLGASSHTATPPSVRSGPGVARVTPSFWTTGYLGGK